MEATPFWDRLGERVNLPDRAARGLWQSIKEKVTLAQYRPKPASRIEVSHLTGREGDYHVLKNPQTKTYHRLSDRDYFLWQQMDGSRNVKDLVVAYYMIHGSFAFGRVARLVEGLRQHLMLVDRPVQIYDRVRRRLDGRRLSHRLRRVWQAFLQMQFAISGLDQLVDAVYRWGGRLAFTWPVQIVLLVASVLGLYIFVRLFGQCDYGVVTVGGSYRWGVVGLIGANLAAILLHEMSHALTVKHFGREVRRGGFMLYFGMPAFFVDTMDIWMAGKGPRLAVTWAGPYSGLVLGGLASIGIGLWPDFVLNALLFQFAFLCYLTVFFNLNPLLELDGYFILMDWLEIPMLRQKSLAFIRWGLWEKFKSIGESGASLRSILASFSWEERIFTGFGALSALWTAYAIFTGTRFWQQRLVGAVGDLWQCGGGVGKTIFALAIAALSGLFVISIGMALVRMAAKGLGWLASKGLFASTRNVAAMVLVAAAVLSWLPTYLGYPWLNAILSVVAVTAAVGLAWRNATAFEGSRFAWPFRLLALYALLLAPGLLAELVRGNPWSTAALQSVLDAPVVSLVGAALKHLAHLALLGAGLALFADTDLGELRAEAELLIVLGLLAGYAIVFLAGPSAFGGGAPLVQRLVPVAGTLSSLLTLTLLLPTLFSFWKTPFGPAWATLALALTVCAGASLSGRLPLSEYLVLGAGLFLHHLAYVQLELPERRPEADRGLSDDIRLERAFRWTAVSVYAQAEQIAGERRSQILAERFNHFALAAGWGLSLVRGRIEDSMTTDKGLIDRGASYADGLSLLLDLVASEVGERLTVRALQRAYDSLRWEEREVGAEYLFRDVQRAEALSCQFQTAQEHYRSLLRRSPLFATMNDDEIDLLASRLRTERYSSGQALIRQGDEGDTFYIVKSGHIEVTQRDDRGVEEVVNQLDRGETFGELALLHDAPRNATCRATVPTEVLCLRKADFNRLVRRRLALREKVGRSIARADLLRRMPLFAEMDGKQIQMIAARLQEEVREPGHVIMRQGESGDRFYLIESGRVRVSVEEDGERSVVTERGPGEYVGEIALLLDTPRTATVTALRTTRLLTLDRDPFQALVSKHLCVSQGLERETSRRMIDLRRAALVA